MMVMMMVVIRVLVMMKMMTVMMMMIYNNGDDCNDRPCNQQSLHSNQSEPGLRVPQDMRSSTFEARGNWLVVVVLRSH